MTPEQVSGAENDQAAGPELGGWNEAIRYVVVGAVVVVLGLLWHGTLSMILTPVWMLAGIWFIPEKLGRFGRQRR